MDELEFCLQLKIEASELDVWLEHGWLEPQGSVGQERFREADLARARLILDLFRNMGVNEEGIDIVMELVDQLHGVRGALKDLIAAIAQEDVMVQRRLLAALERL
uniref:chaperone modulator CbpM n=1 Tax=Neorhizobium sp. EC2-8 TaxID=3129230 RepID=UPI003100E56C